MVPVTLLCMVVNWNERQAVAPKGTKSCRTWEFNLCVRLSPQALSGLKSALSGLKSALSGLKSALSGLESVLLGLKFVLSDLKPVLSGPIVAKALDGQRYPLPL